MTRCLLSFAFLAGLQMTQQQIGPEELQFRTIDYRPTAAFAFRVNADRVDIGVVVRDRNGHPVGGLARGDFEVEDSGKKREIAAFSAESAAPWSAPAPRSAPAESSKTQAATPSAESAPPPSRFLGLLFDDFSIEPSDLLTAKTAAKRFVQSGLEPGDQVAIFAIARGAVLPFTHDVAKLGNAIDHLGLWTRKPVGTDGCPSMPPHDAYLLAQRLDQAGLEVKVGEAINCGACPPQAGHQAAGYGYCEERVVIPLAHHVWEQVRENSLRSLGAIGEVVDFMGGMPGRRILLMVSSGFLTGTLEREQDDLSSRALRAAVVIDSLDARGLYAQDFPLVGRGMDSHSLGRLLLLGTTPKDAAGDPLAMLAATTGGLFFHNDNDIDLGFRELGMAPEFSYSLGIAPVNPPDNRFHRLKVRLTSGARYGVEARPGYFAAPRTAEPPSTDRRIDQEIRNTDSLNDIPARIDVSPSSTQPGEPGLRVVLRLDLQELRFDIRSGVRNQAVTWIAALFDEKGDFVVGRETELVFRLKEATFRRLADGFVGGLTLPAKPGHYRLRAVVQDGLESKIAASSEDVEVR